MHPLGCTRNIIDWLLMWWWVSNYNGLYIYIEISRSLPSAYIFGCFRLKHQYILISSFYIQSLLFENVGIIEVYRYYILNGLAFVHYSCLLFLIILYLAWMYIFWVCTLSGILCHHACGLYLALLLISLYWVVYTLSDFVTRFFIDAAKGAIISVFIGGVSVASPHPNS